MEQFSKLLLGGATIGPEWPKKIENLRKLVQSLCAPLRPFISEVKEKYYHSILPVDVHPYKNISLAHYRVPHKNCQLVAVVPKAHGRANVCAHRKSIKPCNSKKMFRGLFVVVHCALCAVLCAAR